MANDDISLDQHFDILNIFNSFLNFQVENDDGHQKTHACVTNNGENLKYFNDTDMHAEKRIVVEYLENLPKDNEIKNVKIVINYSPCVECSEFIDKFLSGRSDIKLEIVFAGLYYIKRKVPCPSGELQPFPVRKVYKPIHDSTENTGGLKKLIERQVALRTFCPTDWTDLWSTLNKLSNTQTMSTIVSEDRIKERLREDACVKLELEIMLGKFESDNHEQDLMDFFKQVPPSAAGAGVGLDEKFGGLKLNEGARET